MSEDPMEHEEVLTERPLLELTIGGMPAPEVAFDPISREFWMTWRWAGMRIDVTLRDREELRDLIRAALAAAAESEPA